MTSRNARYYIIKLCARQCTGFMFYRVFLHLRTSKRTRVTFKWLHKTTWKERGWRGTSTKSPLHRHSQGLPHVTFWKQCEEMRFFFFVSVGVCVSVCMYVCLCVWDEAEDLTAAGCDVAVLPGDRPPLPGAVLVNQGLVSPAVDAFHAAGLEAAATRHRAQTPGPHPPVHVTCVWRAVTRRQRPNERQGRIRQHSRIIAKKQKTNTNLKNKYSLTQKVSPSEAHQGTQTSINVTNEKGENVKAVSPCERVCVSLGCFVWGKAAGQPMCAPFQINSRPPRTNGNICIPTRRCITENPKDVSGMQREDIGFLTAAAAAEPNQYFLHSEEHCCIESVFFGGCGILVSTCLWDHMMICGHWRCWHACTSLFGSESPSQGPDIALYTAKTNTKKLKAFCDRWLHSKFLTLYCLLY